jgi:predicted DNA-binding mobile mystery protein A
MSFAQKRTMKSIERAALREMLDKELEPWHALRHSRPPEGGWLKGCRIALGVSLRVMAARLGISVQAVRAVEQRETEGTLSIQTLMQIGLALELDLVYALVPRVSSLEAQVQERAEAYLEERMPWEENRPDPDKYLFFSAPLEWQGSSGQGSSGQGSSGQGSSGQGSFEGHGGGDREDNWHGSSSAVRPEGSSAARQMALERFYDQFSDEVRESRRRERAIRALCLNIPRDFWDRPCAQRAP